jgi:hypothetical protein
MNWIEIRALHELYHKHEIPNNETLTNSEVISYLSNSLGVVEETKKKVRALDGFQHIYEQNYYSSFKRYHNFLQQNGLLKPQSRFEEDDIDVLIRIKEGMDNGELITLRDQIVAAEESLRGVSLMFFKNEKYLLNRQSLVDALKQILQIEQFSNERDQQYIYKLECHNPQVIIICENLDFLTKPNKPRKYGIELWYAGGKNVEKLHYIDTRGLPIFYSCDWDFDGLLIYTWVKKIIPTIQLLYPSGEPRSILSTEHKSLWENIHNPSLISGLPKALFDVEQTALIEHLVTNNCWVIEESNDLLTMLSNAGLELQDI